MRLLVLFDLPVTTREKKRAYTLFRRFLLQDGYDMVQWSVYGRMVNGNDDAEKHFPSRAATPPRQIVVFRGERGNYPPPRDEVLPEQVLLVATYFCVSYVPPLPWTGS